MTGITEKRLESNAWSLKRVEHGLGLLMQLCPGAHDQTPLNGLAGLLDTVEGGIDDSQPAEHAAVGRIFFQGRLQPGCRFCIVPIQVQRPT